MSRRMDWGMGGSMVRRLVRSMDFDPGEESVFQYRKAVRQRQRHLLVHLLQRITQSSDQIGAETDCPTLADLGRQWSPNGLRPFSCCSGPNHESRPISWTTVAFYQLNIPPTPHAVPIRWCPGQGFHLGFRDVFVPDMPHTIFPHGHRYEPQPVSPR